MVSKSARKPWRQRAHGKVGIWQTSELQQIEIIDKEARLMKMLYSTVNIRYNRAITQRNTLAPSLMINRINGSFTPSAKVRFILAYEKAQKSLEIPYQELKCGGEFTFENISVIP